MESSTRESGTDSGLRVDERRRHGGWNQLIATIGGRVGIALAALLVVVGVFAPVLAPEDPFALEGPSLAEPSWSHPLGTDALGRDMLSAVIFGARTALVVGCGVLAIAFTIGLAVGTTAGMRGGRFDDLVMRIVEFFQVLPRFFLAILVIAVFGPGIDRLIVVLGLTSWTTLARVVRSEVLAIRSQPFVAAARAGGITGPRLVLGTVIPNVLPSALAYLGLMVGQVLLLEASLGFLGLGDPDVISWGYLASQAQPFFRTAWWLALFPGLAIVLSVLGLNLLSDAATSVRAPS